MKVYVVEDAPSVRELIRLSIEAVGGRVIGEASGQRHAVYAISTLQPDVVIIDLYLADGSGIEVIRAIKKIIPMLTVIVMTSQERGLIEKYCLDCGANYFFEKSSEDYPKFEAVLKLLSRMYA